LLGALFVLGTWPNLSFASPKSERRVPAWVNSTNAVEFFTNMSSRLLVASGYSFDSANIPVYANGHFVFTPDVHRILQVAANIYDASTNRTDRGGPESPFLPSVFRPVFRVQDGNVFIGDWVEETGGTNWWFKPRDLKNPADLAVVQPDDNVYDVPWIIGAKRGFPNFNEFSMQSVAQVTRRLQLRKPTTSSRPTATNQMFMVGISNVLAVELWNAYPSNLTRAVDVRVANDMAAEFCFTNDTAFDPREGRIAPRFTAVGETHLSAGSWAGYGSSLWEPASASFVMPLATNFVLLPSSIYRFNPGSGSPPSFTLNTNVGANLYLGFEQSGQFPIPQLNLNISNYLRVVMIDHETQRVIDYVAISGLSGARNLSSELAQGVGFPSGSTPSDLTFWEATRVDDSLVSPPIGVLNQIFASLGVIDAGNWNSFGVAQASGQNKVKLIDSFRAFCGLAPLSGPFTPSTNLVMEVPFTPTRRTSQYLTWQANDPFVHSLRQDLESGLLSDRLRREQPNGPVSLLENVGKLNRRFEPWGGYPQSTGGSTTTQSSAPMFGSAYKDPLVYSANDWHFGCEGGLAFDGLGKVHRGTPWQTLYLKSAGVDSRTWSNWLGGWDAAAARHAEPCNDRPLLDSLQRLLNTENPQALLSVNTDKPNQWRKALNRIEVISNSSSDADLMKSPPEVDFETNTMRAGDKQAAAIGEAIIRTRGNQAWQNVSDVLATPELSENSPWLNWGSDVQLRRGISDEVYEAIPAQLLPRLRADSKGSARISAKEFILEFTGYDDSAYVIEASTDLIHWHDIGTSTPTNGVARFSAPASSETGSQFYRSRLLP
jgi:hypothetical protein